MEVPWRLNLLVSGCFVLLLSLNTKLQENFYEHLLQFIEMNVDFIPVHIAGIGGKMDRDPDGQTDSWQGPGSVT